MMAKTFQSIPIVTSRYEFLKVVDARDDLGLWSLLVADRGKQGGTTLSGQPYGWLVRDAFSDRIYAAGQPSLAAAYAEVGETYPGVIEHHGVGFTATGDLESLQDARII
jgi:hypothetical protein